MSNALLHKVEVEEAETVETVSQLKAFLAAVEDDIELSWSYRVELQSETLSDGSVAYAVHIRRAERV